MVLIPAMKSYVRYVFKEPGDTDAFIALLESTEEEIQNLYTDAVAANP